MRRLLCWAVNVLIEHNLLHLQEEWLQVEPPRDGRRGVYFLRSTIEPGPAVDTPTPHIGNHPSRQTT